MKRSQRLACGLVAWALLGCACASAAAPPDATPDAAEAVLNSCVARMGDDASATVLKRCPRVPAALRALGYDQLLGTGWQQRLSGISVRDLRDLSRRYQSQTRSSVPSMSMLPHILQQMRHGQTPHSWWQSFKQRLRSWFQLPSSGGGAWLIQLLSAVPPLAQRLLLYATTAAVIAMALWTVWRELIASGVLERRLRAQGSDAKLGNSAGAAGSAELALADVDAAPPGQRAGMLLQLLLQALRRAGQVRAERALSCRELIEQASFDSMEQRQRFGNVARWAERERYAIDAGQSEPAAVLAQGRTLYAQLLARRSAEAPR
ncbi:MAG TPA: hypothetical protein VHY19_08510 [Steroidobacteraceae bacterium]|jgi:hypothetical protein|nr:hypothetical protein [Steroidobacteraceae bacterium]